jgi:hypothetical protein
MIQTVAEFFEAIGGNSKAIQAFEASPTAISNWKVGNFFPAWTFQRAQEIARANGMIVDPKLFTSKPIRRKIKRRTKNHHAA